MRRMVVMANVAALFFLSLLVFSGVSAVHAQSAPLESPLQSLDARKAQELPSYKTELPVEQFAAQAVLHEENSGPDQSLSYQIRLPRDWKKPREKIDDEEGGDKNKPAPAGRILGNVAKFLGPAFPDAPTPSRFEIRSLAMDHEITARNWFFYFVLNAGYTLQGMEVVSDHEVEAQYVVIENDEPYVVRTRAIVNGSRMVLVSCSVPDSHWKSERALQEQIIDSFKFLSPEEPRIEQTHTYSFLDLARFDYLDSWNLKAPNINYTDIMDATLINSSDGKILNGQISLHVVSTQAGTTLQKEVQNVKDSLKGSGFAVGDLIEVPTSYKFQPQIYFSHVEVYKVSEKKELHQSQEFWLALLMEDRYYYIVTLQTPARGVDFYNWARNIEAFRTVIESLRP